MSRLNLAEPMAIENEKLRHSVSAGEEVRERVWGPKLQQLLPVLVLAVLLGAIYHQILVGLVDQWWNDDNYSHGFLIPVVSGYVIWRKRKQLAKTEVKPSTKGLAVLLSGLVLLVLGTAGAEEFTMRLSFVVVVAGLIFFLLGDAVTKQIWFALAYLVFMIPLPYVIYYSLTFPMQLMASKMAASALSILGIPVLRQGNIIHLSSYSLEVVEACSGLRSAISLSALGAAFAYVTGGSAPRQIFLFLSSFPIAIGANVFRLVVTAVGALTIGPAFAESFLHELSGLVVFLVALVALVCEYGVLIWLGGRIRRTGSPSA